MKAKTTVSLSESAQDFLALILDSVGCNQTAAIENALAVYAAFLSGAQPTLVVADMLHTPNDTTEAEENGAT